jgi:hypothetical protein
MSRFNSKKPSSNPSDKAGSRNFSSGGPIKANTVVSTSQSRNNISQTLATQYGGSGMYAIQTEMADSKQKKDFTFKESFMQN